MAINMQYHFMKKYATSLPVTRIHKSRNNMKIIKPHLQITPWQYFSAADLRESARNGKMFNRPRLLYQSSLYLPALLIPEANKSGFISKFLLLLLL